MAKILTLKEYCKMNRRLISLILAAVLLAGLVVPGIPVAHAANELKASDEIVALIKGFEGFYSKPYKDYSQYSIGYGSSCDPKDYPNGITKAEAEELLREELGKYAKKLNEFANRNNLALSQNQFDALLSFTYNIGPNWMNNTSDIRTAVLKGATGNDFLFAITRWCTAGTEGEKQILTALVNRRLMEANVYLNGIYSGAVPSNYDYVIFNNNLAEAVSEVRIQGYDSRKTDSLRATPVKSGYKFLGWYTAASGGEWVTTLNAATAGKTLYGHWQQGEGTAEGVPAKYKRVVIEDTELCARDGKGNGKTVNKLSEVSITAEYMDANGVKWGKTGDGWINLSKTAEEGSNIASVMVTVNTNDVNVRKGPGTSYERCGKAQKGDVLSIIKVEQGKNYLWGQFSGGWICLDYTDYNTMVGGDENSGIESVMETGVVYRTDKLNIRNLPGTSGTLVVGSYKRGETVTITKHQKVGGTTWGKTDKGWISLYYIDAAPGNAGTNNGNELGGIQSNGNNTVIASGTVDNCTILKIRSGPGTNYDKVGGYAVGTWVQFYEKIAQGRQIWGRTDKGWICMTYVELDVEISDSSDAVIGVVYNCSQVNVRKAAGTKSDKVAKLPRDTKVQIFETTTVDGTKWGRISLGWVCMDYIKLGTATDSNTGTNTGNNTGSNTGNNSGNNTVTPEPAFKATVGTVIKASSVNLRKEPGIKYDKTGTAKKGEKLLITETVKVGSATWGKTDKGWIHMYYVKLDTKALPEGAVYKSVTVNGLNIRAGAGVNYDKVGSYSKGDAVIIYEQTKVGDKTWGRTDKGWISMEYTK